MLREHCKVGMKVVFGRPNGEKTIGEVVEIHETKAEIRTLESRGDGNRGSEEHRTKIKPAGSIWSTSFGIMEPLNRTLLEALHSLPPKDEQLLSYLKRGSETLRGHSVRWLRDDEATALLQTIFVLYKNREWVASWSDLAVEVDQYNRRLALLFDALGRPVSEAVSRAWAGERTIRREINEEFSDGLDKFKAYSHWNKILKCLPDDYDHKERIYMWNDRKLSSAWIEAGLNKTGQLVGSES
jgi:hypothetical protein